MSILCLNCGHHNRPNLKFCTVCGQALPAPAPQVPQPLPLPAPHPPPPPVSPVQGPVRPNPSPSVPPASWSLSQLLGFGPAIIGQVNFVDQDRQEKTPFSFNLAWLMIRLSFLLMFLAFCALVIMIAIPILQYYFVLAIVFAIAVMFLGGGCLFPTLLGLFSTLLSSLLAPILSLFTTIAFKSAGGQQSQDAFISVLSFQVVDDSTGRVVDVVLYRNTGETNVRQGDKVKIYGSVQRSKVVQASKIQVYESGGRATNHTIGAMKPLPIWLGLLVLGATIAGLLYQAMEMGLIN